MIRRANHKDLKRITELYIEGLKELGAKDINPDLCYKKVETCYFLAPCFLLEIDDIIFGMWGLTTTQLPWNGSATLADYMMYLLPEYRSLDNLGGLIDEVKNFAQSVNLPLRLDFQIADGKEAVKRRLFEMYGFKVSSIMGVYNGNG